MTNTITREQWLNLAGEHLRILFESVGETVPTKVRASCGFPSKGALGARNRTVGQCWNAVASADSHAEIFISPAISDSERVLDILAHEWIHAIHPNGGHGKLFKRTATAIGLEGKMTATVAGEKFTAWARPVLDIIGDYPHAELQPANAIKKQSTRMLKCVCSDCGYIAYTSGKWLAEMGAPYCPEHGQMTTD